MELRSSSVGSALIVLALAAAAAAPPATAAQAPERARTEALARRASERLQALQREADRLTAEERTLLGDLRKLEVDREIKAEELRQIAADGARVAADLLSNEQRTHDLEALETSSRPELRSRLVGIYQLGQGRFLPLVLSAFDVPSAGPGVRS